MHAHAGDLAAPRGETAAKAINARLVRVLFGREGLLVVICCGYAALLLAVSSRLMSTDGWLALVSGREIVQHGLPHHDTLTLLGHGRSWVDQQWGSQLALYAIDRVGGLRLVLALQVIRLVAALAGAMVYARRRGAHPRWVAGVALVSAFPLVLSSGDVRTQSFVYIPFVALIALLTRLERPSYARVAVLFALVAVWANVHGSVLLAAGLVALRGLSEIAQAGNGRRLQNRGWLLVLGPWACVFASPYGPALSHYYASTAFNSAFTKYLGQWAPTALSPLSLPIFALIIGLVWLLGRARDAYNGYEQALLMVAVLVGLLAMRNWPWTALIAVMLAPKGLERIRPLRGLSGEARVNAPIAVTGAALATLLAISAFMHAQSWYAHGYPPSAGRMVSSLVATHPNTAVYANVRFADWLLWLHPELAGRIRYDARYELLKSGELESLVLFRAGSGVDTVIAHNRFFALDPGSDKRAVKALRGRVRVLLDTPDIFVADAGLRSRAGTSLKGSRQP
jgi:hypothetical protein